MISFSKISKQYGRQILFVDASFQLNPGEKVGLVGPNGSGKTTLFRMIVGEETADEGDVSVPKRMTIGYFRQDVEEMSGRSVLDEAILGSGRVGDLHHELTVLGSMAKCFASDVAMEVTTNAVQLLGGYGYTSDFPVERFMRDARVHRILEGTNEIMRTIIARRLLDD